MEGGASLLLALGWKDVKRDLFIPFLGPLPAFWVGGREETASQPRYKSIRMTEETNQERSSFFFPPPSCLSCLTYLPTYDGQGGLYLDGATSRLSTRYQNVLGV